MERKRSKTFGQNLKRLRWVLSAISEEEWTQTSVANALGKSLQTISLWEAGNLPTPRNQQKVVDFYSAKLSLPLTREMLHNKGLHSLIELSLSDKAVLNREPKVLIQIKQLLSVGDFSKDDLTLLHDLIQRLVGSKKKAK